MKKLLAAIILSISVIGTVNAQVLDAKKRTEHYNTRKTVAINGYDPVSYFEQGEALKGDKNIRASFKGILYYFSSEKNKQLFLKGALKYEPQYGGWCAYAMGLDGSKVGINPETYKIIDNKLYLFYNKLGTNTLKLWNKDEQNLHHKADKYWNSAIK